MAIHIAATLALQALMVASGPYSRGQEIVAERCARCHSVGLAGESPNPQAPPFRTLGGRYPVADLMDALAQGATPSHTGMPRFHLPPEDAVALTQYVMSVQIGVGAARPTPSR